MKLLSDSLLWLLVVVMVTARGLPGAAARAAEGRIYYVSSSTGHVSADGTSPSAALEGA